MSSQIPEKLFILEMANNHMGSAEHGLRIISDCATVCKGFPFNFAVKLQYRHLDSFIHPDFKGRNDIKYVKRFLETRLTREEKGALVRRIREHGFIAMCTPFDEVSVDDIIEDGFDIIKIGSCSFTDWPLLEKVVSTDKPLILSTAGASQDEIDNVVGFLDNRKKDYALMHCVGEYPTRADHMHLNQIEVLRTRYPHVRIGFSTHEDPNETLPVAIAIAKGCTIFEKHVGVKSDQYKLNEYSAEPAQLEKWLKTAEAAFSMLGKGGSRLEPSQEERQTLFSLRRGIFAKRDIEQGEVLRSTDVFMAIPTQENQITANDWSKYTRMYAIGPIRAGQAVLADNVRTECIRNTVLGIVIQVQEILKKGNIVIPKGTKLEISHHYGLERFYECGACLITIINREYCKKLIIVLPNQKHPNHYHKKKDETLHVLYGTLKVTLEGITKDYGAGEMVVVEPGMNHSFESAEGCVFEEISSTHYADDSVYSDPAINQNSGRKTLVTYWNDVVLPPLSLETALKTQTLKVSS